MTFSRTQLSELYASQGSVSGVARSLGVSRKSVVSAMKRLGVEHSSVYRKYPINEQFFASTYESEIQFYWAGFLASSAHIVCDESYRIELNVAVSDKVHLERMIADMNSNIPVKEIEVMIHNRPTIEARTVISSKQLVLDLERFNIFPKKEKTFQLSDWLIKHKLLRHFLRGWFDGRGGFYNEEMRTSGTIDFLNQFIYVLMQHAAIDATHATISLFGNDIYRLRIYTYVELNKIANYLYSNAVRCRDNRSELFCLEQQNV